MLKIVLCEDEKLHQELFEEALHWFEDKTGRKFELEIFSSAEQLLCSDLSFHILFLDIGLQEYDGIEVGKQLGKLGYKGVVNILTSYNDRAIDGYHVNNIVRYLTKPIEREKFEDALLLSIKKVLEGREKLIFSTGGTDHQIKLKDIIRVETCNRKLIVRTTEQGALVKSGGKLAEVAYALPELYFVQIHRSFIVNLAYVRYANKRLVAMVDGEQINISRIYAQEFSERYAKYKGERAWKTT